MKIIDFEVLYKNFVDGWIIENSEKILKKKKDPSELAEEIYAEWVNEPAKEIGGLSPKKYFDNMSGAEAVEMLKSYISFEIEVPSPLLDKLSNKEYEELILPLISEKSDEETVITAISLLEEMQSEKHINLLINIILGNYSEELKCVACEVLSEYADKVKESLIPHIKLNGGDTDMYIADVLVYSKNDDRIYKLLANLFERGSDYTLYAAYLGMYGDERALPLLEKRINSEETGYIEYTELQNSIERLGGETPKKRDFSHDPDYKALKNIKI